MRRSEEAKMRRSEKGRVGKGDGSFGLHSFACCRCRCCISLARCVALMARSSLALALVAVVLVAFVHTAVAASTTRGDGGEETRTILVAIKQSNVQEAERLLNEEISNVQHPNYGRYLTLEQLAHLMAPAPASVAAVCDFLTQTLSASTCSLTHSTCRAALSLSLSLTR